MFQYLANTIWEDVDKGILLVINVQIKCFISTLKNQSPESLFVVPSHVEVFAPQSVPAFSLGPTVDIAPKCLSWSIWINTSDLQEVVCGWCVYTEMLSGNHVVSNRRFKLNGSHSSFVLHFLSCPHVIMFEHDMELRIRSHNVKFMFSCKIESNRDIVLLLQDWVFVPNLQYVYIVLLKRERF